MARFYPLYVRRSDGKQEVISKGKRREKNEPTEDQLDQKPDKNGVSDFYREVSPEEMKSLDWRRKLGGMLARELDWKDKAGQDHGYMLVAFPENYRLYEHVKKTEKDGKTEVKSKTHAGGGNDRQDAYLYGHPAGRRKRFRSPADFFPHLLWLCTDESGDPDNCGCKICSPEDLENAIPGAKIKAEKPVKQETAEVKPVVKVKSETSAVAPRPANAQRQLVPTPLPQRRSSDQHIDSQYHTFMYRPGELVWFRRGQAWGLGVVLRRWITAQNQYHYTVQPLSYPFHNPQPVTKSSDTEMRPWLAWSVPRFTNDGLNQLPDPPRYDTADWQGIAQKRYGTGDLEVDGSILAAKSIDSTYTPFGLESTSEPEPGVIEKQYHGIYLGAEKIWAGEPVRLQIGSGTDILVLHSVVERVRAPVTAQQRPQQSVHLIGDVYTLASVSHSDPTKLSLAAAENNPQLPQRLTQDLAFRNARSIPSKRTASYWKLIATQSRIELNDVKGRWYEASLLLPILQQSQFEELARKGEVPEASLYMNSRNDCQNSNRPPTLPRVPKQNTRKETRIEAFGRAVPPDAQIIDGVEAPLPNGDGPVSNTVATTSERIEIDPRFETADAPDIGSTNEESGAAMDEFMNLDDVEEHSQIPGFGQVYDSQPSQERYY